MPPNFVRRSCVLRTAYWKKSCRLRGIVRPWENSNFGRLLDRPDQLLVSELPRIEAVIAYVCQRNRCRQEEAEEFAARVKLKLVEDDYAVLRRFEGRGGANLRTYLTMVVVNFFRDYCNHLWGKWRASAEAIRLGPEAVQLEKLLRDGYSVDAASEILRTNHHVELSPAEIEGMAGRLPRRLPRRFEGDVILQELPDQELGPEDSLLAKECARERYEAVAALKEAVAELPPQDRVIVRLWIERDFRFAEIARTLHLDEKRIYREVQHIVGGLRKSLERKGIGWEKVARALGLGETGPPFGRRRRAKSVH